jgi:hypothetical protein
VVAHAADRAGASPRDASEQTEGAAEQVSQRSVEEVESESSQYK